MIDWSRVPRNALVSGSAASIGSTLALVAAARAENRAALQPVNATSHWLNGEVAASRRGFDARHTAVGYATNHAACLFWALFFEAWRAWRSPSAPPLGPLPLLRDAAVMSAVAAAVDYGATPKRFTPGWEFVLSKTGMAVAYGGLALGLAAGARLVRPARR